MSDQQRMHADAEHSGVHDERANLDWIDEGALIKILNAGDR